MTPGNSDTTSFSSSKLKTSESTTNLNNAVTGSPRVLTTTQTTNRSTALPERSNKSTTSTKTINSSTTISPEILSNATAKNEELKKNGITESLLNVQTGTTNRLRYSY